MQKIKEIDYILYGEGEEVFDEFLNYLEEKKEIETISNIAYRKNREIIINPPRMVMKNLGKIPKIYSEDLTEYENKIIYYESSRGCPFNCKFCLSSTIDGLRFFQMERVLEEMKLFLNKGVKQVKFIDRTFNADIKKTKEIMEYIYLNDNKVSNFHFEVTAHLIDEEFIKFLSKMPEGLFQFEIGVQSTNNKTIEDVARTTDFEKLSEVVKKIKMLKNIHLHLDLIAGLPYEDYESFKKSFNDVYNLKPDKLQLGFLKLLKGSQLRKETKKHEFKYTINAPYEIMENKYISYDEILYLKDIEELVEVYANENDFEKTLFFAIKDYENPFIFFEKFAKYSREIGYFEQANSKKTNYKHMYKFLAEEKNLNEEFIRDILRFDFMRNSKTQSVPIFLKYKEEKEMKDIRFKLISDEKIRKKYFPCFSEKDRNKIIKNIFIDEFRYDMNNGKKQKKVYTFIYNKPDRAIIKSNLLDITDKY